MYKYNIITQQMDFFESCYVTNWFSTPNFENNFHNFSNENEW